MNARNIQTSPPLNPYFALLSGVLAVSTGAIFARLAEAPALVIAAYRVGLATLVLVPFAWWKARNELKSLTLRDLKLAMLSGLFLAFHFAAWISSLDYTSVTNSVVLVNTNPLWVGLFTPFITQDRIRAGVAVSIIISVAGATIIGAGDLTSGGRAIWGDFLALLGSISAAIYLLIGRNLRQKLSLLAYVLVCYGCAAVILWTIVIVLDLQITGFSPKTLKALWAMALVTQLIGHTSYNWALKWFSAGLIAVSLLGEPVGSTILAYLIFKEGLTWTKLIGGTLVLSAIYIAGVSETNRSFKTKPPGVNG
jgi:drug/metabolite transporter (DMT)-like permease